MHAILMADSRDARRRFGLYPAGHLQAVVIARVYEDQSSLAAPIRTAHRGDFRILR